MDMGKRSCGKRRKKTYENSWSTHEGMDADRIRIHAMAGKRKKTGGEKSTVTEEEERLDPLEDGLRLVEDVGEKIAEVDQIKPVEQLCQEKDPDIIFRIWEVAAVSF